MATTRVQVVKRPIQVDGKPYTEGQFADMPTRDVARFVNAGLVVVAEASQEAETTEASTTTKPEWKLKMSPKDYLEKFPSGPQAELALSILALSDEDESEDPPTT